LAAATARQRWFSPNHLILSATKNFGAFMAPFWCMIDIIRWINSPSVHRWYMSNSTADNTAPRSPQGTKRMSISLSGDTAELLEFLAESQGISQNEAIRRAIATDVYFVKERLDGSRVLLQKPDKEIREVLFR
jgi:Ribbon-helix-helix protein, copG family